MPSTSLDPQDPDSWRRQLGLLPVPLIENRSDRFVFLNGSRGNFCLETSHSVDALAGRDIAWSADVGHYVRLTPNYVEVQRWDTAADRLRRVPLREVIADPQRFHAELERDEPARDVAVVPHFMSVFRRLRTSLDRASRSRHASGTDALQAFLYLLAVAASGSSRGRIDTGRWALAEDARAVAERVPGDDWDGLVEMLTEPRRMDDLRPLPDIVLRHTAGMLFQEAHYQTVISPQLDLFAPAPARLGAKDEASAGVYFTPPALARALVEEALRNRPEKPRLVIFDPACGSGEFLREAARQLRGVHKGQITLVGWDASAAAVAMARFVLAREASYDPGTAQVDCRVVEDSLSQQRWPEADILLMNPPFVAWNDLSPQQRDSLKRILGSQVRGKPDLAGAFLLRAIESLSPDGTLGAIIPASMLDGRSAASMRQAIADSLSATLVARLGSHGLFAGARVDAALYVAARRPQVESLALWADHRPLSASRALRALRAMRQPDSLTSPATEPTFSVYPRSSPSAGDSWSPRPYKSWRRLERLRSLPRAGSLFEVWQGVLTGLNEVFVLSEERWRELPQVERRHFRPAVVNESISAGRLVPAAFVFYPYGADGLTLATQAQLEAAVPHYYARFLKSHKSILSNRKSLRSRKWWELVEPRGSWQFRTTPRLVSTYFGRAGSFAFDSTGRFVVVQGYAWESRGKPLTARVGHAYVALLSAPLIDELLGAVADHVGGGQWNLSRRFVQHLPMCDLSAASTDPDLLTDLAACGQELARGGSVAPDKLEELAVAAYGLSEI